MTERNNWENNTDLTKLSQQYYLITVRQHKKKQIAWPHDILIELCLVFEEKYLEQ